MPKTFIAVLLKRKTHPSLPEGSVDKLNPAWQAKQRQEQFAAAESLARETYKILGDWSTVPGVIEISADGRKTVIVLSDV